MTALKYLGGYDEQVLARVRELIAADRLGAVLRDKYGEAHTVRNDNALYEYTVAIKERYMRSAERLN